MFDNLTPEEATIAYIIRAKKSFSDTITQYDITDEYIVRRGMEISPRKVRRIIEGLIEKGCRYCQALIIHMPVIAGLLMIAKE